MKNADQREAEKWNIFLGTVITNISDSVMITDHQFKIIYINKSAVELFGYKEDELLGRSPKIFFPGGSIKAEVYNTIRVGNTYSGNDLVIRADGTTFMCEYKVTPIMEEDDQSKAYVVIQRDVTEKNKLLQELKDSHDRYDQLAIQSGIVTWEIDEKGLFTYLSPNVKDVIGGSQEELVNHFYFYELISKLEAKKRKKEVLNYIRKNQPFVNYICSIQTIDGKYRYVSINGIPQFNEDGTRIGYRGSLFDITEKIEREKKIEILSFHDHLTGLYNRHYMSDAVKRLDVEEQLPLTLMIIDVNGLKLTNDAFGHEVGDRLLITVAGILKKSCRENDLIGRMGGDEFCILLSKTDEVAAERIKKRLLHEADKAGFDSVIVSLAVGHATKNMIDEKTAELMTSADNNMYRDKLKRGKIMRSKTIELVLRNINFKYDREQIHTQLVAQYSEAIGKALNLSKKELRELKAVGELHDIGKIMTPPELLNKTDRLTAEEFAVIKRHPETGYQILKSVNEYSGLAEIVLYHHERWDGNGYPEGLVGEAIPFFSRIIAVADAYEAMTSKRSYKKAITKEAAIKELEQCAGTQFDPEIVRVFIDKVLMKMESSLSKPGKETENPK